jgi:metal-responsive CopG/Arc/MetJ family transcriptional regulator
MDTKIKKTFTINKELYKKFEKISEKLSLNKSKFIENKIKEFVENKTENKI